MEAKATYKNSNNKQSKNNKILLNISKKDAK